MSPRPTILLARAIARLAEAGLDSPSADARILLMHASGASMTQLLTACDLDDQVSDRFEELVEARCSGIPVQHLTGEAWFRRVRLEVGPGVFIPRPETELVAGAAIDEAASLERASIVELCAGSGAITAAICDEVPRCRVIAVEKDPVASDWLRRNLAQTPAEIIESDMATALPQMNGQIDIVVANPPYIPWAQSQALPADVGGHDPAAALFAADDGMAAIRVVIGVAARLLRPGGLVVIEHGENQSGQALADLAASGFTDETAHRDLAGRLRFVTARRMSGWEGE